MLHKEKIQTREIEIMFKKLMLAALLSAPAIPTQASPITRWLDDNQTVMVCYPAHAAPYFVHLGDNDSIEIWQPGTRIVRSYTSRRSPLISGSSPGKVRGLALEYMAARPDQDRVLVVHLEKGFNYVRSFGTNSDGKPGGMDSCKMCGDVDCEQRL
jgi:hypothetical protein